MIKILKVLVLFTVLVFTGCDEPLGEKKTKYIVEKSKMDPRLKAYPEAIEWYKDSMNHSEAAFNLGVLYHKNIKDFEKALFWLKKSYKNNYKESLNNIASVYRDLGEYDNAIVWYKKAIENSVVSSYYNLGYLYHTKLKDYTSAIKYYEIAIEIESSSTSAMKNLAILYKNQNEMIKSSAYFLNLIEYPSYDKKSILNTLKNDLKIDEKTIKKGYELQLIMPGLPRRYTGGI